MTPKKDKEFLTRELEKLNEEITNCTKCPLHKNRTNAVPGEGNPFSGIMFIGEAPGKNEDLEGRPFVGAAGKLLEKMLKEHLNLERFDVYITNVIKCRPPNNRDPHEDEIKACSPYLERQLNLLNPTVIVTLGNHSTKFIFKKYGLSYSSISKVHGRKFVIDTIFQRIYIYPMYHPAAILYNRRMEYEFINDFVNLKKLLDELNLPRK